MRFKLILVLLAFTLPQFAHAATIGVPVDFLSVNKGLVGWWTFDGKDMTPNVRDKSGYSDHGNLFSATGTTTAIGKMGQSLVFDGSTTHIDMGNKTPLQLGSTGTISAWMKATPVPGGVYPMAFGNLNFDSDSNGYAFAQWYDTDPYYSLILGTASGDDVLFGAGSFDSKWHLVTGTWDGTTEKVYTDGVMTSSQAQTLTPVTNVNNFTIGSTPTGTSYYPGSLDDVRVYNRALTAAEILTLYNVTKGGQNITPVQPLTTGLAAWWTMDGQDVSWSSPTAGTVADRSGNGITGTLTNMTRAGSPVLGAIGQAFKFSGQTDQITNATLTGKADTISLWIKPATTITSASQESQPLDLANPANGVGPCMGDCFGALTNETVGISNNPVNGSGRTGVANYTFNAGQWYNLVFAWNSGASKYDIYINSIKQTTINASGVETPEITSASGLIAAHGDDGDGLGFPGAIDDIRIYRQSLTASQITQLYNLGSAKQNVTPANPLTTGLISWWTFDGKDTAWSSPTAGTVADLSPNGFTATLTNMNRATSPAIGKIGQAMNFDGVDDYVDAGDLFYSDAFTVCVWIKPRSFASNDENRDIVEKRNISGTTQGDLEWELTQYTDPSGNPHIEFASWPDNSDSDLGIDSSTSLSLNKWYHACGVQAGNGNAGYLYINGVQDGTAIQTAPMQNTSNHIQVGVRSINLATRQWDGLIDDVRIYSRALSATEVLQLYNQGK